MGQEGLVSGGPLSWEVASMLIDANASMVKISVKFQDVRMIFYGYCVLIWGFGFLVVLRCIFCDSIFDFFNTSLLSE